MEMKRNVFLLGILLLFAGTSVAVIATSLAEAMNGSGEVGEPFDSEIVAVSSGVIDDTNTFSGQNTIAGSSAETFDTEITNNANQDINAYYEVIFTSSDDSLTSDYINVLIGGVAPAQICDVGNAIYMYRTFNVEAFGASATDSEQVSYEFPITATGYFVGDYMVSTNAVPAKAC
jgi:hypothetical protein